MKRQPTHPGLILRDVTLPALGRPNKTEIAKLLGIGRQQFHRILKGEQPITLETAVRLEQLFGGRAEFWLDLQRDHDLWAAERRLAPELRRLPHLHVNP